MKHQYDYLFDRLCAHTVLLTPTRRLARHCRKAYQKYGTSKHTAFPALTIASLDDWLETLWFDNAHFVDEKTLGETCLNTLQTELLWQKILADELKENILISVDNTAAKANQAYEMIVKWQINLEELLVDATLDSKTYVRWHKRFEAFCKTYNYLPKVKIPHYVLTWEKALKLPKKICLLGFDEHPPVISACLAKLESLGVTIFEHEFEVEAKSSRVQFQSKEEEWAAAANYARAKLKENPNQRVGVVIPELQADQLKVVQAFNHALHPLHVVSLCQSKEVAYTISAGVPLLKVPVIQLASLLLRLSFSVVDYTEINNILRSSYLDLGESRESLLRFSNELMSASTETYHLQSLIAHVVAYTEESTEDDMTALIERLAKVQQELPKQEKHFASQWVEIISRALFNFGWPGTVELSSYDYQAIMRFNETLTEMKALDAILAEQTFEAIFNVLNKTLLNKNFQIEAEDTDIHVLGLLEAGGLLYDKLWVCNVYDEHFPPLANPNPFIPMPIQKAKKLPHANALRELEFSNKMISRFTHSSSEVIFSYPEFDEDKPLKMSALIADYPEVSKASLGLTRKKELLADFGKDELIVVEDTLGAKVTATETRVGTHVIKSQAQCPFQAYARYRLKVKSVARPETGISPAVAGIVVHEVLYDIWQVLQSQEHLLQLPDAELNALIQEKLRLHIDKQLGHVSERTKQLEEMRLSRVLLAWFALEKKRGPFKIESLEKAVQVKIKRLLVSMRIDRIDNVAGDKVLIDYKTGRTSITDFLGDRPFEPQLLLYAYALEEIAAITFAEINRKAISFKGIADEVVIPGVGTLDKLKRYHLPDNWTSLMKLFKKTIINLVTEYQEGQAEVSPKLGGVTCARCDLHLVCRINH